MRPAKAYVPSGTQSKRRVYALIGIASLSIILVVAPSVYPFTSDSIVQDKQADEIRLETGAQSQSNDDLEYDTTVTPLMQAARDGEIKILKSLLTHGADINARDSFGWSALYYAVMRYDLNMVKALVKGGADVGTSDNQGTTVLMQAAIKGNAAIVKYLLEKGADVNARAKNGMTALSFGKNYGKAELIEMIKAAGGVEGERLPPEKLDEPLLPLVNMAEQKNFTRPVPLNSPFPNYTEEARRNRVTGTVSVRILIGVDGTVKKVRITSGLPDGLSRQALISVYKLRFKPATKNGQPVEFWTAVAVEFNLK